MELHSLSLSQAAETIGLDAGLQISTSLRHLSRMNAMQLELRSLASGEEIMLSSMPSTAS